MKFFKTIVKALFFLLLVIIQVNNYSHARQSIPKSKKVRKARRRKRLVKPQQTFAAPQKVSRKRPVQKQPVQARKVERQRVAAPQEAAPVTQLQQQPMQEVIPQEVAPTDIVEPPPEEAQPIVQEEQEAVQYEQEMYADQQVYAEQAPQYYDGPTMKPPKGQPKLTFDLPIPRIGTMQMSGYTDLATEQFTFSGKLKELKTLTLGPLVIDPPTAYLSAQYGLQIKSKTTFFGRKGTLGLEEFIPGQDMIFAITLQKPFSIPISPWKKLQFKTLYLALGATTQRLFTRTSLFSETGEEDVEISFGLQELAGYAEIELANLRLSSFIRPLKGGPLDRIITRMASIKINNFKNPTITLTGVTDFTEATKHIKLPVVQDFSDMTTEAIISKDEGVRITASFAEEKAIQPFKGISGLEEISLEKVNIGFDLKEKNIFVGGTSTILGMSLQTRLEAGPGRITLIAQLPPEWRISNVAKPAKGTFLDNLELSGSRFVLSSKTYIDEELNIKIRKGINVVADIPIGKLVQGLTPDNIKEKANWYLKNIPQSAQIAGSIGPSLPDIALMLNVQLGGRIFPPVFFDIPELAKDPNIQKVRSMLPELYANRVALRISGDGPSIEALAQLGIKPTPRDPMLRATGTIKVMPKSASIAGSIEGRWENPLGVATLLGLKPDKLALFDCALEMGIDYEVFFTTYVPTLWGMIGGLKVGDAVAQMGFKVTTNIADLAFLGKFVKELKKPGEIVEEVMVTLTDVVRFANDLDIPIPIANIPELGFMGDIRFAPKGTRIGEIVVEPGITLKGQLHVPNVFKFIDPKAPKTFKALVDMSISLDGIKTKGTLTKINIPGFLEITGTGMDKKYGTDDDGPTLDGELTLKKQEYYFSGKVNFLSDKLKFLKAGSETKGIFNKNGLSFSSATSLFGDKVKLSLQAQTVGKDLFNVEDFIFKGEFKDDFRDYVEKSVTKLFDDFKNKAANDIANARKKIQGAVNKVNSLEKDIENKKRRIEELKRELTASNYKSVFENQLTGSSLVDQDKTHFAQSKLLHNTLHDANFKVDEYLKQQYQELVFFGKIVSFVRKKVVEPVREKIVEPVVKAVKKVVDKGRITAEIAKLGVEIGALETARIAAVAALKTAQGLLTAAEHASKNIGELGTLLIKGTAGAFKIRSANISFSTKELLHKGKLPLITFDAVVFGKELKNKQVQFDFTKPDQFFKNIFNIAKDLFS